MAYQDNKRKVEPVYVLEKKKEIKSNECLQSKVADKMQALKNCISNSGNRCTNFILARCTSSCTAGRMWPRALRMGMV